MSNRKLHLSAVLIPYGHHAAAWKLPDAVPRSEMNFKHYAEQAKIAEAAKFDAVFLADFMALVNGNSLDSASRSPRASTFEPLTLLSALAAVTDRIGLVGTASTTYNTPFHVARKFASLDWISNGRAGWNQVTSGNPLEAGNFGIDEHPAHAERYDRAHEFIDVVKGLWDTWDEDAFIYDKTEGRCFDPKGLHLLNHVGPHFRVSGPLNMARPPQGYPVMVQAGSSEPGKEIAAKTAEVVFTAQTDLDEARAFYADVKGRMAAYGRSPDELKILPGIFAVVGATEQEARDKYKALQKLQDPRSGLAQLTAMLGQDLSGYDLDGPVPELQPTREVTSRHALLAANARRDGLTIRELSQSVVNGLGHLMVVGSYTQVADEIQRWFENHAADGFNVKAPYVPEGLRDFAELVVPELRRRGLFREDYDGSTLREHLGLARPASRHAARPVRALANAEPD